MTPTPSSFRAIDPRSALITTLLSLAAATAHAGPPFQTDDPDPVEYRHFEMYAFELSDSTGKNAGGTVLEVPAYEVNYGVVPNVQLHLVLPLTTVFPPANGPTNFGLGDTELGAKVRVLKETKRAPEVGIFPFVEAPSGNADKGLGVGKTWYRLPLWLQKSWGPDDRQWTSYGGAGETIVPQTGYKNYPFAGWLVQRQLSKKWTLGGELFGHGAEGEAALSTRASTLLDLGGIYEVKDGLDLLFAAGRSVYGQPETYTYVSLYWTWGPKAASGSGDRSHPPPGVGTRLPAVAVKMRPS
jgi:Putative MetA-pathway of phenol degradation